MEKCKNSCCRSFDGIGGNIYNVEGRPFSEIVLTEGDLSTLLRNDRGDLVEERRSELTGKTYHILRTDDDGRCLAHTDGRCSVNGFKPTLCRAFPFYFDMFSGLCIIGCEGFSGSACTDLEDYRESVDAAKQMYWYWMEFYGHP